MGANFAVQSHDSLAPDEDEALPTRWTYQVSQRGRRELEVMHKGEVIYKGRMVVVSI